MKVLMIVVLLSLILFISIKSTFETLLVDSYSCNTLPYPSGNVPGNYLGLSDIQKQELKRKFVEYSKE